MRAHRFSRSSARGFTLLELVIVLGITGLIFGGLWGLLSGGSGQLQAQTAAQQYRAVIEATRKLLTPGQAMGTGAYAFNPASYPAGTPGAAQALDLRTLTDPSVGLLSANFAQNSGGAYYDAFGHQIQVMVQRMDANPTPTSWRYMVYSSPANGVGPINDKIGAQVAALIGSEGGFVYSADTEGCLFGSVAASAKTCGAYNAFALPLSTMSVASGSGRIATLSYTADNSLVGAPWLARLPYYTTTLNTMSANMDFADSSFKLNMRGSPVYLGDPSTPGVLTVGSAIGDTGMSNGKITANGGSISLGADGASTGGGTLYMGSGDIRNIGNMTGAGTTGTFQDLTLKSNPGNARIFTESGASVFWTAGVSDPRRTQINSILLDIAGTGHAETFQAAQFIYSSGSSPSDMRLKMNIAPIPNALDKVLKLRGVNYDWRASNRKDIGLVAQDVQKVFPEVVSDIGQGRLGVDYAKLIAPLVEAIRTLKNENDALTQRVNALQRQMPAAAIAP